LNRPFDLVIFDCDGVVVDSEPIGNRVFGEWLAELGLNLSEEERHQLFLGRSLAENLRIVEQRLGRPIPADAVAQYKKRRDKVLREEVEAMRGIPELLDRLDLPYCIASSGDHDKMRATLGGTGLLPLFEGRLFSATEVPRAKPAPDVFLYAAKRMGAAPSRCVVIEDSVNGVKAAHTAAMTVFGFAGLMPAADLTAAGADETFTEVEQLVAMLGLA
jgi:HAD superfamily hydrolase (TIGR01509 family)